MSNAELVRFGESPSGLLLLHPSPCHSATHTLSLSLSLTHPSPRVSHSHTPSPRITHSHTPTVCVSHSHTPSPRIAYPHTPSPRVSHSRIPLPVSLTHTLIGFNPPLTLMELESCGPLSATVRDRSTEILALIREVLRVTPSAAEVRLTNFTSMGIGLRTMTQWIAVRGRLMLISVLT